MFSLESPHRGDSNKYTQHTIFKIKKIFFTFCNLKVCCVFSLESPHRGDSNKYTQYTIFKIKKNHPKLSLMCNYGNLFLGSQERVRNSHGKRAISVRAIEVLL